MQLEITHAGVADGGAGGMEERHPRCVAHDEHLRLVEEPEAARVVDEQRLRLVEQAIDLRIRVEGVVVRVAAPRVEEDGQEVRWVGKVGFPAEEEERDGARVAYRLDERGKINGFQIHRDTDAMQV